MATANRDYLRGIYSIIKDNARDVRFVFVTGVSMFSRVSLFSGLNNLDKQPGQTAWILFSLPSVFFRC